MAWYWIGTISKNKNTFQLGYILILISAVLAALVHVLAKPLLDSQNGYEIHPVTFAACIYIINGAFFTPLTRKSQPVTSLGKKNLVLLTIIGISEIIALVTYFFGLKESTASNAAIFSNGEILFSLLITVAVFKESLQKKELGPFVMMLLGMLILPVVYDFYSHGMVISELVIGDVLIIVSGIFYALDVMICRYLSDKVDSRRLTQITSLVSGTIAVAAVMLLHIPFNVDVASLGPIAFFAIGGTGLATILFLVSLRIIGGVRTILLFSTNSVLGVIFAALMLNETISTVNMISVALTLGGVYLLRNRIGGKHDDVRQKKSGVILQAI
jgi:drug/metabolite transporter (DMT)-like permease